MWSWRVTITKIGTEDNTVITGATYSSETVARWMLTNWLHRMLPGMFAYRLVDAEIIYIQGKENDEGTCLQEGKVPKT